MELEWKRARSWKQETGGWRLEPGAGTRFWSWNYAGRSWSWSWSSKLVLELELELVEAFSSFPP